VNAADEKQPYLVCYYYGPGAGLWGVIRARSEAEITDVYPGLTIVRDRPQWMDDDLYASFCDQGHDIDGPPWSTLNALLADPHLR
jgi:hypothetical protein